MYCDWEGCSELMRRYHDEEWGVPLNDDKKQFEFLMMEAMQCGLNWNMMMNKRQIFRACFDNFDYNKVAAYTEADVQRILNTKGMIRSEPKITAVINNARCFCSVVNEFGSFTNYLHHFAGDKMIIYHKHSEGYIPVSNGLSDKIAKDLKKRGFKFLGSVTVYSHLQACGIINDHSKQCPCYQKLCSSYLTVEKRRYLEKGVVYFGDEHK